MMNNANVEGDQKVFFSPGDVVTLRQDIPNKPTMLVSRIERNIMRHNTGNELLKGIKCRWFTTEGKLQEAVFSTKDLILI